MDEPKSTPEVRKCKRCGVEKPLTDDNYPPKFWKTKKFWESKCRKCAAEIAAKWYQDNRARADERGRADWKKNKDKYLAIIRQKYANDPALREQKAARARKRRLTMSEEQRAKVRAAAMRRYYKNLDKLRSEAAVGMRKWRAANPEKSRLIARERKAMRLAVAVEKITKEQIDELFRKQRGRCAICGKKITVKTMHIDHIKPISRGGEHRLTNIQLTHGRCNMSKHAHDPILFMQKRGFLL